MGLYSNLLRSFDWSSRFHRGVSQSPLWLHGYPTITKIPMAYPKGYPNGYPIYPWLTHGLPMAYPWLIHGLSHISMAKSMANYLQRSLRWSNEDPISRGLRRAHRLESLRPKESSSAPHRRCSPERRRRNDCNVVNPIIQPLLPCDLLMTHN